MNMPDDPLALHAPFVARRAPGRSPVLRPTIYSPPPKADACIERLRRPPQPAGERHEEAPFPFDRS
jgi:hypothetical protein